MLAHTRWRGTRVVVRTFKIDSKLKIGDDFEGSRKFLKQIYVILKTFLTMFFFNDVKSLSPNWILDISSSSLRIIGSLKNDSANSSIWSQICERINAKVFNTNIWTFSTASSICDGWRGMSAIHLLSRLSIPFLDKIHQIGGRKSAAPLLRLRLCTFDFGCNPFAK